MLSLSPIDDPIRRALDANVYHFSELVAVANVVVAVGVALEGIEISHAIVEWWKRRRRNKRERTQFKELSEVFPVGELRRTSGSHSEEPKWVKLVLRIGIILVVAGVVGEWRWGTKLEDAHNDVHRYDLEKIAVAEREASDAAASAKTAREDAKAVRLIADGAKRTAKQANTVSGKALKTSETATTAATEAQNKVDDVAERADDLDRAIWQTQFLVSARSLRNRELLISTLRKFNKKKVVLKSFIGDAEGWDLCNSLFNAAYNAEMDPVSNCGKEYFSPPLLTGILIFGPTKQEIEEFANIMADAVDPGGAAGMRPEPGSTLTIRVGIKAPYFMDTTHVFKPPTKRQTTKPNTKP